MSTVRLLAIAALTLAAAGALGPSPAAATGDGLPFDVPASQALAWPLPLGTTVVIDGPASMWRMRGFAEEVDAALPGVDIAYGAAKKKQHRRAFVVTLVTEHRPRVGYAGFTEWGPVTPQTSYPAGATITLNTYFRDSPRTTRRQVAAHELMHVLGFRHHAGEGITGVEPPLTLDPEPSAEEWAALHAYYG